MQNSLIYEMFKKYNINYTDPYLVCPLCNKPFCNDFNGNGEQCNACQDKQRIQFGDIFCGNYEQMSIKPYCTCGQQSQIDKSILILYLMVLIDYIDNLEYQIAVERSI